MNRRGGGEGNDWLNGLRRMPPVPDFLRMFPVVKSKRLGKLGPGFGIGAGCGIGIGIGFMGVSGPFYDLMEPFVSWGPRAAYINYMDLDLGVIESVSTDNDAVEMARVWGEKYFLENYDRLVRAKTLIDPYNVFKHQQGIPPAATTPKAEDMR